jgi:hypothetical protein
MNSHSEGVINASNRVTLFFAKCFSANQIQDFGGEYIFHVLKNTSNPFWTDGFFFRG